MTRTNYTISTRCIICLCVAIFILEKWKKNNLMTLNQRSRAHDQSRVQKPQTANNQVRPGCLRRGLLFFSMCCTESVIDSSGRASWLAMMMMIVMVRPDCTTTNRHPSTHFTPSSFLPWPTSTWLHRLVSISWGVLQTPWKGDFFLWFFENYLF